MRRKGWSDYMREYRARTAGARCRRCSSPDLLPGLRSCSRCLALDIERKHPDKRHDTMHHARLLELTRRPLARCEASGLTLEQLAKVGYVLQVDRINPARGYVPGNCQVIACWLNRLKARHDSWPWWAPGELREIVRGAASYGDGVAFMPADAC